MRKLLAALLVLTVPAAFAQSLQDYLKLRAENHVSHLSLAEAVYTVSSGMVIELSGQLTGTSSSDSGTMFLLTCGNDCFAIKASKVPDWFSTGNVLVRTLVRVDRDATTLQEDLTFIGAIAEQEMAAHEQEIQRRADLKAQREQAAKRVREQYDAAAAQRSASRTAARKTTKTASRGVAGYSARELLPGFRNFIQSVNPRLAYTKAEEIAWNLLLFSAREGVDPLLILALVMCESGFNPDSTSRKGAAGLGQLMPGTAAGMGVTNPYDTAQNLEATVRLVRGHLLKYKDPNLSYVDIEALGKALAAYNAGSGAVKKWGGIPPYKETQNYVRRVIDLYRRFYGQ